MTTHIPGPFTAIIENISEADARLIAAAPDMLAALRDMTMMYRRELANDVQTEAWDAARAAIAKAEGTS
jgi:hypothetical protein